MTVWLCRECDGQTGNDYVQPPQRRQVACEKCGNLALCHLCYEEGDKRPKPKKKVKRRLKFHRYEIRPTRATWKALKKEAKRRAVSIHSLIMTFIEEGLNPKTIISGGYVPARDIVRTDTMIHKQPSKEKRGPAGYQAPSYFKELKEILEKRKKKG